MNDEAMAYIGLGSNKGDRLRALREALEALTAGDDLRVDFETGIASLYETSPVGGPRGQSAYLNSVVRVVTQLAPIELLKRLLAIEASLGRTREIRWDRRVIDLDILLYGGLVLSLCNLALPHPRLHERRFVLEPLSDIAADVMHPTLGKTVSQMAAELREGSSGESVVRVAGPVWRFEPMDVNAR